MSGVYVLGGYQTDFARHFTREGLDISDVVLETVEGTLEAASDDAEAIDSVHVANAFGEMFVHQGHLGAMPATVVPSLWGKPSSSHDAACASGGVALLGAMAEIESGRYEQILVTGVEVERNVGGAVASTYMEAVGWYGREVAGHESMTSAFNCLAEEYDRRYGLDYEHLAKIAELNVSNAARNPLAQTRSWDLQPVNFSTDDAANPSIEPWIRRNDCSKVTDGGCGVILASQKVAAQWAAHHGASLATLPRIAGWGHHTAGLSIDSKLSASHAGDHLLPHVRDAALDAFQRAGISGVDEIDGIELHDCFSITEYIAIDHFGITEPGEAWKAIENGDIEMGGRCPINPSGGLLGVGHAVGATGVRMVHDAARQVTNAAGESQIDGANAIATINIGGSATTAVSFVVTRDS
jgi:acetyl-CoA C-acetyltransferase